uniref:Polyprotein n=1 Tax=Rhizoctonia solani hypovirus 6 TaxID=2818410 RepID=A0AAU6NDZ9_9VIRU
MLQTARVITRLLVTLRSRGRNSAGMGGGLSGKPHCMCTDITSLSFHSKFQITILTHNMSAYTTLVRQLFAIINPSECGSWGEGLPTLLERVVSLPTEELDTPSFDSRDSRADPVTWSTKPHPVTGRKYRLSLYRPQEAALGSRAVHYTGLHGCHPVLHNVAKLQTRPAPWFLDCTLAVTQLIEGVMAGLPLNTPYVVTAAAGRPVHLNDIEASLPGVPIFVLTLGGLDDPRPNVYEVDLSRFKWLVPRSLAFLRLAVITSERLRQYTAIIANSVCSLGVYTPALLQSAHAHKVLTSFNAWGFNPVCLHLAAIPATWQSTQLEDAYWSLGPVAHWVYGADEIACQTAQSITYIVESPNLQSLEFYYEHTGYESLGVIAGHHEIGWSTHYYPTRNSFVSQSQIDIDFAVPGPITRQLDNSGWDRDAPWRGKGTVTYDTTLLEPIPPPAPVIPVLTSRGWVVPDGKVWRWNEENRGFRHPRNKDHIYLCVPDPISDFTISQPRPDIVDGPVFNLVNTVVAWLNGVIKPHTRYFVTAADNHYLHDFATVQRRAADFLADEIILFAGAGELTGVDHNLPRVHTLKVPYINESGRSMMYYRLLPYIATPKEGAQFVIGNVRAGDAPPVRLREKFWAAKRSVLSWNQYHRGPVMNAAHYGIVGGLDIHMDLLHLFTEFAHTYGPDELYFYKHDPVVVRESSVWDCVAADPLVFKPWPHHAFVFENGQVTRIWPDLSPSKEFTRTTGVPFDRIPLTLRGLALAGEFALFIGYLALNPSYAVDVDVFFLTIGTTGDRIPFKYLTKGTNRYSRRSACSLHLNDHQAGKRLLATLEGTGSLRASIPDFGRAFELAYVLAEHYTTVVPRQLFAQLPGQILVDLEPSRLLTRGGEVPGNIWLTCALKVARWLSFGYRVSVTVGPWRLPRSADGESRLTRGTTIKPGVVLVRGSTTIDTSHLSYDEELTHYHHTALARTKVLATGNGTIETARYLGAEVDAIRPYADTTYLTPTIINHWPVINPAPFASAAMFLSPFEMVGYALSDRHIFVNLYTLLSHYIVSLLQWVIILLTFYFKGRALFFGLTTATFFFGTTNTLTIILGPVLLAICLATASHIGLIPVTVMAGRLVLQHFDLSALVTFVTIIQFPITLKSIAIALMRVIIYTNQSRVLVATAVPVLRAFGSTKYLVVRPFQFSSAWLPHVALWDSRTCLELSLEPTHFRSRIPDRVFFRTTRVQASDYEGVLLVPIPQMTYATQIPGFKYLPLGNCFMVLASYGHASIWIGPLLIIWKLVGLEFGFAVLWYTLGQAIVTICLRLHQL